MGLFKKRVKKAYKPERFEGLKPVDLMDPTVDTSYVYGVVPSPDQIPKGFIVSPGYEKWKKIFHIWFYDGIEGLTFIPWDGVDVKLALKQIHFCMSWGRCFPHEDKILCCSYLMNEFFQDVLFPPEEWGEDLNEL